MQVANLSFQRLAAPERKVDGGGEILKFEKKFNFCILKLAKCLYRETATYKKCDRCTARSRPIQKDDRAGKTKIDLSDE